MSGSSNIKKAMPAQTSISKFTTHANIPFSGTVANMVISVENASTSQHAVGPENHTTAIDLF